jgi:hypothetical protein
MKGIRCREEKRNTGAQRLDSNYQNCVDCLE